MKKKLKNVTYYDKKKRKEMYSKIFKEQVFVQEKDGIAFDAAVQVILQVWTVFW